MSLNKQIETRKEDDTLTGCWVLKPYTYILGGNKNKSMEYNPNFIIINTFNQLPFTECLRKCWKIRPTCPVEYP